MSVPALLCGCMRRSEDKFCCDSSGITGLCKKKNLFIYCVCSDACTIAQMWQRKAIPVWILSFNYVGPSDQSQVMSLGNIELSY